MGTTPRLDLGFAVPVFAAPGEPALRVPSAASLDWHQVRESVLAAERLGYNSAWFSDHLFLGKDGAFLESWSTLAYFAGYTTRMRLVPNHYNINFRHAPLIAKAAATVDIMTGGRLELFLSPGAREVEHTSYGYGWEPSSTARQDRLREAVAVIRRLWRAEPTDFAGEHYHLDAALSAPGPAQATVPIWLGGPLDDIACDLIARTADGWNALPSSLTAYAAQADRIDNACRRIGRPPHTLRRSLETQILVIDGGLGREGGGSRLDSWFDHWDDLRIQEARGRGGRADPKGPSDRDALEAQLVEQFVVGNQAEVAQKLAGYADLGVDEVVCWFMDFPDPSSMVAVATEVRNQIETFKSSRECFADPPISVGVGGTE